MTESVGKKQAERAEKMHGKNAWMGTVFVLTAGVCWGFIGFFSSHLSGAGYSPVQLAFLRNIVASVAMWGYLLIFRRETLKINWKDLWMFIGTGTFSVVFFNIAYFMTIEQTTLSVAAILLSIWFFLQGSMTLFTCLMVVVSAFLVYSELESAGEMFFMLPMIDASIDRVEEIDRAPRMDEGGSVQTPKHCDISFEHVDFSYGERKIIRDVSFTIPEGTTTAIVGPSGSGKTTLTSLMARFWDVDSGAVKLGGIDVKDYALDSLMRNFSMVFQRVYLFNDSIENNIKFGKPDATHEEVVAAAKAARCHDFITALPDGYDTIIGESGATISGGERQRLSIARAMLKDAPIIILDEATANVDPENEAELQEAVKALTAGKTLVMIAHRMKTVQEADQILVLDQGRIVQRGRHAELMQQGGIYADFVCSRRSAESWRIAERKSSEVEAEV